MSDQLNGFLRRAVRVARSRFGGPITYGAGLWEDRVAGDPLYAELAATQFLATAT